MDKFIGNLKLHRDVEMLATTLVSFVDSPVMNVGEHPGVVILCVVPSNCNVTLFTEHSQ